MKKFLPLIVVIGLLLVIGGWASGQYNGLVREDQEVKTAWSQVENVLQRRFDLIPNLVETVKGYATHERETLEAVTNARAHVGSAGSVDEKITANNELTSALSRLMVVVENYPDLKANQGFIQLQDELAGTENRISVERGRYNQTAKVYNVKVKSFPTVLFAGAMGFKEAKLFEAVAGAETAPKVDFSH